MLLHLLLYSPSQILKYLMELYKQSVICSFDFYPGESLVHLFGDGEYINAFLKSNSRDTDI